jgi:hypothetical protein
VACQLPAGAAQAGNTRAERLVGAAFSTLADYHAVTAQRPGHPWPGRSILGLAADLTAAGYVPQRNDGRRNRYQIQAHMPLPEPTRQDLGPGLSLGAWSDSSDSSSRYAPHPPLDSCDAQ